jgi:hypothetical protein
MKLLLTAYTAIIFFCADVFAQPLVNEIMYAPTNSGNEWFEITNTGDAEDLANWKWKDATSTLRTITTQNFILQKDSFVVVCQDSTAFKSQFGFYNGKIIQTPWSALNNSGDNLILINSNGVRIDSISYSSSWGGNTGGISLERKNPNGQSNLPGNWGTCLDPQRATPGKENSVRTKEFDLTLKTFVTNPVSPVAGGILTLSFVVSNSGLNIATNYSLKIYDDRNLDSIIQQSELINSFELTSLEPDDSTSNEMTVQELLPGRKQFIALIDYQPDQDTLDNRLVKSLFVSEPGQAGSIIINEIMYEPLTSQAEWIELFNPSSLEFDLIEWRLRDNSGTLKISDTTLRILPGGYLIITSDSSIMNSFSYLKNPDELISIVVLSSLSLNNSGETITIEDSLLTVIDKCSYSPSMHDPELEDTRGISIERINPALPSAYLSNWSSSTNPQGGTPGRRNSIFANATPASSELAVSPNPFSPDGDGTDDVAVISCSFSFSKGTIRANIYDIRGRMVRTLANNEQTGSERTFLFNGYSDNKEKLGVGIYIVLIEAIDNVRGVPVTVKAPLVIAAKL